MPAAEATVRTFLQPILPFLREEGLTELCINRPHEIWCEGRGGWKHHAIADDRLSFDSLSGLATVAAGYTKQDIDSEHPVCSTTLPDGERCQIVIPPAVPEGTVSITIRKPGEIKFSLSDFDRMGFFKQIADGQAGLSAHDQELLQLRKAGLWERFFDLAVKTRKNIIISGATGSGKTTFSKSLIDSIPAYEGSVPAGG